MKVRDLFEGDVVQFPNRKHDVFVDKIRKVSSEMPQAFQKQQEAEEYAEQVAKHIDENSEGRKAKFKTPAIMTHFRKGIHPFEAIEYMIDVAFEGDFAGVLDRPVRDEEKKFIIDFTRRHIDDIIRILQHDAEQYKIAIQQVLKTKPLAPQYVTRPLDRGWFNTNRSVEFFQRMKTRLQ